MFKDFHFKLYFVKKTIKLLNKKNDCTKKNLAQSSMTTKKL